jgi:hypothetical protein
MAAATITSVTFEIQGFHQKSGDFQRAAILQLNPEK